MIPIPTDRHPTILVIGATGQTGSQIVEELDREPGNVHLRLCSRRQEQVERWQADGRDAVLLDLDEPRTFGHALAGVDRLYLLTGYTVDMLVQSKTLVDAAVKSGVSHIVHQRVFGNWDCTDPHFAWHLMIEKYIEASGIAWTHLHPNYFMENLINVTPILKGSFPMFVGDRRVGWIALKDIAAVAAHALREGPARHGGKEYWLSTESLNGPEAAKILSEVLGTPILCDLKQPEDLQALFNSGNVEVEPKYAESGVEVMRQVIDGRMSYLGSVRDDVPCVTGRSATSFREWAFQNRSKLLHDL